MGGPVKLSGRSSKIIRNFTLSEELFSGQVNVGNPSQSLLSSMFSMQEQWRVEYQICNAVIIMFTVSCRGLV